MTDMSDTAVMYVVSATSPKHLLRVRICGAR